jgi:hypothetical protein
MEEAMKTSQAKKTDKPNQPPQSAPRRRGLSDAAATVPKSFTVPFPVIVELRQTVSEYGSQGRALQVGSELASRMTQPPKVEEANPEVLVRITYKLLPRTIRLILELAEKQYGSSGQAIAACVQALKLKKLG